MAKYITLEGLKTFLDKLNDSVCVKLKTDGGLVADSNGLYVKLKEGGGLKISNGANGGLIINPNNKFAVGPTLTTQVATKAELITMGTQIDNYGFTMEPHQLTYIDLYEHTAVGDNTEEECVNLNNITLDGFGGEVTALSSFPHAVQYFLQIKLGEKSCSFKTYAPNATTVKPKIYWADGLALGALEAHSVYEVVFTRQLQDSTHLTAAWTQFK